MPFATIEVRRSWSPEQEIAIIDAVHAALVEAFRIPAQDKHIRLVEHAPHRFATPPTLDQPEFATLIAIDCFAGRSLDAKRALYVRIVDGLEVIGIPRDHVSIVIRESGTDNWGFAGGKAATDQELGFRIDV